MGEDIPKFGWTIIRARLQSCGFRDDWIDKVLAEQKAAFRDFEFYEVERNDKGLMLISEAAREEIESRLVFIQQKLEARTFNAMHHSEEDIIMYCFALMMFSKLTYQIASEAGLVHQKFSEEGASDG